MRTLIPLIICMLLTVFSLPAPSFAKYSGGTGTEFDPYLISTPEDLDAIGATLADWASHFLLTADINMTGYSYTTALIAPDTSSSDYFQGIRFTGVFDGNDHKVINLTIDTAGADNDYLGLFGYINSPGQVNNLGLEDVNITGGNGSYYLGGLVGYNRFGTISDCFSTASVTGGDDSQYLGGLVGSNYRGTISDCFSTASLTRGSSLGGLVGENEGTISDCFSTGQVTGGDNSDSLGGLVGENSGTISNCFSTSQVTGGNDSRRLGGLVGKNSGTNSTITNCYATGAVTGGNESECLGGLAGVNSGIISNCFSTSSVTGDDYLGGLVGGNSGTISNCSSTGSVTGGDGSPYPYYDDGRLGGLVGENFSGTISNCFSTGSVTGGDHSFYLGGLVGSNYDGTISNCYATGSVTGGDKSENLGGLVGRNYNTITNCYATGSVTGGDDSHDLGGLVGSNYYGGTISNCFWDVNTSDLDTSSGGMGLTTEQMQDIFHYSMNGWAGNTHWTMIQGQYPRLAWENAGGEYIPEPVIELTGSGTQQDPYQIQTVDDLQFIGLGSILWDKHYILTADLDMAAVSLNPIGYDRSNSFTGVFDGNGHVICNLSLNLPDTDGVGLFGYIGSGGQVKHLGIEDINILGNNFVGGLVGFNYEGTISNCYSTGSITGRYSLGGLVGSNSHGIISNCFSTASVTGRGSLGGLAGFNIRGTISDCFSTGSVTGGDDSRQLGGLVGYHYSGTISDCYATGSVAGGDYSGGLGGLAGGNSGTISDCYATGQVTGGDDSGALGGLVGVYLGDWVSHQSATVSGMSIHQVWTPVSAALEKPQPRCRQ
ncbi:MAG: GLUG motif-containing protein [Planctomycetota bacterium]